jgi:hypothetical protein
LNATPAWLCDPAGVLFLAFFAIEIAR